MFVRKDTGTGKTRSMDVIGIECDPGVFSVRGFAVLVRLLTGSQGFRIHGRVFVSRKVGSERS